jgi:hypothetical protein
MPEIFISYLREDKEKVARIAQALRNAGADLWIDLENLNAGSLWRERVREAIQQSNYFVACFSKRYTERTENGIKRELDILIDLRRKSLCTSEILPLKLDDAEIPDVTLEDGQSLRDLHWYSFEGRNWESSIASLVEQTVKLKRQASRGRIDREAEAVGISATSVINAEARFRASLDPYSYVEDAKRNYTSVRERYNRLANDHVEKFNEDYHPARQALEEAEASRDAAYAVAAKEKNENDRFAKIVSWTLLAITAFITFLVILISHFFR